MAILVTGSAGLVGTRVVRKLLEAGEEVIHQDIRPPAREFNAGRGKLHVVVNDASQGEELLPLIVNYNVDRVIHLAALQGPETEIHPHRTSVVNVAGTTSLFEVCRWTGRVQRVVYASSSGVYGPQSFYGERPVTEEDPVKPGIVYAAGKVYVEVAADRYIEDHGMDIRGLRPGPVYGHGRQTGGTWVFGPFISEPAVGRPVEMPFEAASAWPMIYVDDVAEYFIRIAQAKSLNHRIYNAGGPTHTLDDIYQVLRNALPKVEVTFGDRKNAGLRIMSNERIEKETGYVAPPLEQRVLDQVKEAQQLYSST